MKSKNGRIHKGFIKWVNKLCSTSGLDIQLIDIEAEWDSKLSLSENKTEFLTRHPDLNIKTKAGIDEDILRAEVEEAERERARLEEQEKEIARTILKGKTIESSKFKQIRIGTKQLIDGRWRGMVIHGEGGIGKSYVAEEEILNHGLQKGIDYCKVIGHSTPTQIVKTLYEYKDRLIVIDDVDTLLKNTTTLGILKGCLGEDRRVSWKTPSKILNSAEQDFAFNGRILIILNEIPRNNQSLNALLSRCFEVEVMLSRKEKFEVMTNIANGNIKHLSVIEWLRKNTNPSHKVDIRLYQKACVLAETNKLDDVKELLLGRQDKTMAVLVEVIKAHPTARDQELAFMEETGKSRPTFYRYKRRYKEEIGLK